jgi:hypothetical protein
MAAAAGDAAMAAAAEKAAAGIKASFQKILVNPETGFVAGWRSADGQLHDYAFVPFNALAISLGLLDDDAAKRALSGLWRMMEEMELDYFTYGVPSNLIPVPACDMPKESESRRADGWDAYGLFINGSLTPYCNYLMYSLRKHGMTAEAEKIARGLDRAFELGLVTGGHKSGTEFFTWEGYPCGYEGVLVGIVSTVGGILQTLGVSPMPPGGDWWPEE